MCDTMGKFIPNIGGLFAKNSDRSPNEPQVMEFYPAMTHNVSTVKATYIEVEQVKQTKAIVLFRPVWMWGGEIGVNECGVCIGNEAVFTKGKYGKTGLLGMDMLRLALERSSTAKEARDCIIALLETYGQGGNCGYDHPFYYDNGFLIMDHEEMYILETAGKEWVYKKTDCAAISNRLSIGDDGTKYSEGPCDFAKKHTEPVYSTFSKAANRRRLVSAALENAATVQDLFHIMRLHEHTQSPLCKGSVGSPCMHFGGLVGDHTTLSMAVELLPDKKIRIWTTGRSTPCISLFKPYHFGPICTTTHEYWMEAERFHRSILGHILPGEYYEERDALEREFISVSQTLSDAELPAYTTEVLAKEREFFDTWKRISFQKGKTSFIFRNNWAKKNALQRD